MHIDLWTLGLQTINALVLVWILGRFLFRPVAAIIAERQATAMNILDDARAARADATIARDQARQEAADIAASRASALNAIAVESEKEKGALVAAARADVEKLRAASVAEIARERQSEDAAMADRASRLAVDIATRLLDRLPPAARVAGFLDGLMEGLAKLPEFVRARVGADDDALRLVAPHALSDHETQACRAALERALGRKADLSVEVDPDLVAGLELRTRYATIRNSFRADLESITAELTRHDGGA